MVNRAATRRRVIIMRGFMRRSGTFWFLGTWLGLSALPLAVHAEDEAEPLACPDLLAAQRNAADRRPGGVRSFHGPPSDGAESRTASRSSELHGSGS